MRRFTSLVAGCVLVTAYVAYGQVSTSRPRTEAEQNTEQQGEAMSASDMAHHMSMMNKMMMKSLGSGDRQYDARFIDMMAPHHEGAVLMAKDALKHAQHEELKTMAAKMIKDQQKEIEQLKKWRQEWYGLGAGGESGRAE